MSDMNQDAPLTVNAQYIRDLSFELPDPVKTFEDSSEAPNIEVSVNVSVDPKEGRAHEVILHIGIQAIRGKDKLFILELDYAGMFVVGASVPQEAVNPILLIECPRLLFPYARALISSVTREAGFPALTLNPIDFVDLYRRQFMDSQGEKPAEA
jgi:preprotein translocase subunit SecB